jgi:PAS domain S-box-containing protein
MSAQLQAGVSLADGSPARQLIDELSRIYRLVLVADHEARVHWVSDSWLAFCGGCNDPAARDLREAIPKLPRPEQSFSILSELREQGFLLRHPVELVDRDHTVQIELNIFRLVAEEDQPPLIVAIGRPASPEATPPVRHSVLDSSADAILAVDGEGFVTYANPAVGELVGIATEKIEGSPVAVLTRSASDLERLLAALDVPEPVELEFEVERGGGDGLPVRADITPHRRSGRAGDGAVVSLRDLTAQRRAETELAHRNEELEHCVNSLAHDLRSPLVALLGFSRLLRQDYGAKLDDTGSHFLDRIEQAGRTMEELIHDLLELSRIGKPGERPAMVDPRWTPTRSGSACRRIRRRSSATAHACTRFSRT